MRELGCFPHLSWPCQPSQELQSSTSNIQQQSQGSRSPLKRRIQRRQRRILTCSSCRSRPCRTPSGTRKPPASPKTLSTQSISISTFPTEWIWSHLQPPDHSKLFLWVPPQIFQRLTPPSPLKTMPRQFEGSLSDAMEVVFRSSACLSATSTNIRFVWRSANSNAANESEFHPL